MKKQTRFSPSMQLVYIFALILLIVCVPALILRLKQSEPLKYPTDSGDYVEITPKNMLRVNMGDEITAMPLEEYVLCAVSGEMPALFESEALCAQAVAARTFAVRKARRGGCSNGGDVCTSSAHCQAFCSFEQRKAKWGSKFDEYEAKLQSAVDETRGVIATYKGEPIEALYHSTSGGMTENSENVYKAKLPYLRSVVSNETSAARYENSTTLTRTAMAAVLCENGADISPDELEKKLRVESRYKSGRVRYVLAGKKRISGQSIRRLFSLDSTNFDFEFSDSDVTIRTKGFGHGVGMSQTGANDMARRGENFRSILTYYYTGIELAAVDD